MSASAQADLAPVTSRHQLQCVDQNALKSVESSFQLGPFDHIMLRVEAIQVVFVYKTPTYGLRDGKLVPIDRLRRALCRLLDYYPHLTGRLHFHPSTNVPEIISLGTGAELLEASCSEQLDSLASQNTSGRLLITNMPGGGNDLPAPFDPSTEGVCRDPIFSVKHTRVACGGVALGIRLHHIVCDAQGFFNPVNDLAELYRGLESSPHPALEHPPEIRSILRGPQALSMEQRQSALQYQTATFFTDEDPRFNNASTAFDDALPTSDLEIVGRVLRFSGHDLADLKARATDPSGHDWVSTTESLSAYLCQTVYRARLKFIQSQSMSHAVDSQLLPGFWTSIDMRGSNRLNMPSKYFPNCIYSPYTNSLHPSIADCPLWEVSRLIHNLVREVDPESMRMTTQWIAAKEDKSRIRVGFIFGKGSFTAIQWCKINMYAGNHLDMAANGEQVLPALVSPPFTPTSLIDGLAFLLATEEKIGMSLEKSVTPMPSMDVNLSLIKPLWDILDSDEEFRRFYT